MISSLPPGAAKQSRSSQVGGEQSTTESHRADELLTCLSNWHSFIANVEKGAELAETVAVVTVSSVSPHHGGTA